MTQHVVVDKIGTSDFRKRLSHHLGRVRHGGHCLAIERKNEDPVYLISAADFALLSDRIAEVEDGPVDPVTKRRRGGIMAVLRWERRAKALSARIARRRTEREAERDEEAASAPSEGAKETDRLLSRALARIGKSFEGPGA